MTNCIAKRYAFVLIKCYTCYNVRYNMQTDFFVAPAMESANFDILFQNLLCCFISKVCKTYKRK